MALHIRNVFNVYDKVQLGSEDLEAICTEILKPKTKPVLTTAVYRTPNSICF